jgi:2-succinyl-5-enolpyruvyl-6-hydroxy-3-cyclohexene-1-carboxylate synthase
VVAANGTLTLPDGAATPALLLGTMLHTHNSVLDISGATVTRYADHVKLVLKNGESKQLYTVDDLWAIQLAKAAKWNTKYDQLQKKHEENIIKCAEIKERVEIWNALKESFKEVNQKLLLEFGKHLYHKEIKKQVALEEKIKLLQLQIDERNRIPAENDRGVVEENGDVRNHCSSMCEKCVIL